MNNFEKTLGIMIAFAITLAVIFLVVFPNQKETPESFDTAMKAETENKMKTEFAKILYFGKSIQLEPELTEVMIGTVVEKNLISKQITTETGQKFQVDDITSWNIDDLIKVKFFTVSKECYLTHVVNYWNTSETVQLDKEYKTKDLTYNMVKEMDEFIANKTGKDVIDPYGMWSPVSKFEERNCQPMSYYEITHAKRGMEN